MPNNNAPPPHSVAHAARARFDAVLYRAMSTQIERWLCIERKTTGTPPAPMHHYALVSVGQCEEGVVARMVAMQEFACERLFMQTPLGASTFPMAA